MLKIKILAVSFLLSACSIEIMPPHSDDDMSAKYGSMVSQFSEDSILAVRQAKSPGSIMLEEINYKQLSLINKKSKYTWVILTAPWCGECAVELENTAKKIDELKKDRINIVFIYTNYDVKNIKKELFKIGYTNPSYILNAKDYSSNEAVKINNFSNQILAHYGKSNKIKNPNSVPQNFFFNSGSITMYRSGSRIDADSVKYYFK